MMTKRNFQDAAKIVVELRKKGQNIGADIVQASFAELFYNDNPRFDVARFKVACIPVDAHKL